MDSLPRPNSSIPTQSSRFNSSFLIKSSRSISLISNNFQSRPSVTPVFSMRCSDDRGTPLVSPFPCAPMYPILSPAESILTKSPSPNPFVSHTYEKQGGAPPHSASAPCSHFGTAGSFKPTPQQPRSVSRSPRRKTSSSAHLFWPTRSALFRHSPLRLSRATLLPHPKPGLPRSPQRCDFFRSRFSRRENYLRTAHSPHQNSQGRTTSYDRNTRNS